MPLLALASLLAVSNLTIEEDIGLALLEAVIILALIILGGRYLLQSILQRVARYGSAEIFTASAVLLVLGAAVLMAQIGLSMAMGAFVAGLLVADSEFRHQVMAEIQPFRGLLLGLFFMSMGMSLELELFIEKPLLSVALVLILMTAKVAVLWPLARSPFLRMMALNEAAFVFVMVAILVTPKQAEKLAMYPLRTYRHVSACFVVALRPEFIHKISVLLEPMSRIELLTY